MARLSEGEIIELTRELPAIVGDVTVGAAVFAGANNSAARADGARMLSRAFGALGKWSQKLAAEAAD